MLQCIIELEGIGSIKEKRKVVLSLKQRMRNTFNLSVSEVDLTDSLQFTQIGAALVSNDARYNQKVMQKLMLFIERQSPGRIHDMQTHSEVYDS